MAVSRIVTCDIGGTHARFAFAEIDSGRVAELGEPVTLQTTEHSSFQAAWNEFGRRVGVTLPDRLAIGFAGPVGGETLKLTNSPWVIRPDQLQEEVGVSRFTIVNDFGAVAHAVAILDRQYLQHACGPDRPLPAHGVTSIVGPGTGLGVAMLNRRGDGSHDVIETEGGHVGFAPLDSVEDAILARLRTNLGRVSVERIVSGPGLWNLYEALAAIDGQPLAFQDEAGLWAAALDGRDSLAAAALDRLYLCLGAVAGDLALAQGAAALVIAGGVGFRLGPMLARSGFYDRFIAKGRFEGRMRDMPVKLVTHPNPGLLGAAAAFAAEHA